MSPFACLQVNKEKEIVESDEDIDGAPIDDEDIDGVPISDEPGKKVRTLLGYYMVKNNLHSHAFEAFEYSDVISFLMPI